MIRDSQKERLYETERLLRSIYDSSVEHRNPQVTIEGVRLTLPPEGKYADIASLQTYCDKVCDLMGAPHVRVEEHRLKAGRANAFYQSFGRRLVVPNGRNRWALRELVVLHELAHHLTPLSYAAHGPEFVANYITLLERAMGPEAGLACRLVYAANGVKEGAMK